MITLSIPRENSTQVLAPKPNNLEFSQASLKPAKVHRAEDVVQNVAKQLIGNFIGSLPAHEKPTRLDLDTIIDHDTPLTKHEHSARILYYAVQTTVLQLLEGIRTGYYTDVLNLGIDVRILTEELHYTVDCHTNDLKLLIPVQMTQADGGTSSNFYPFKIVAHSEFEGSSFDEIPNNRLRINMNHIKGSITFLEYRVPYEVVVKISESISSNTTYFEYGSGEYFSEVAASLQQAEPYHKFFPIREKLESIVPNHLPILGPALFMEEFGELGNRNFVVSRLDPDSIFGSEVLYSTLQCAMRAIGFKVDFNQLSVLESCNIERNFGNSTTLSLAHLSITPETFTKFSVTNSDGIELKYDIGKVQVNYAGKKAYVMLVYDHQKSRFTTHAIGISSVESIISFLKNAANHDSPLQITSSTSSNVICALAEIARSAGRDTTDSHKASSIEKLQLDLGSLIVKKIRCDIDKHVRFAVSCNDSTIQLGINLLANTYSCH